MTKSTELEDKIFLSCKRLQNVRKLSSRCLSPFSFLYIFLIEPLVVVLNFFRITRWFLLNNIQNYINYYECCRSSRNKITSRMLNYYLKLLKKTIKHKKLNIKQALILSLNSIIASKGNSIAIYIYIPFLICGVDRF